MATKVITQDGIKMKGNYGTRAYRTINGVTYMYPIDPTKRHKMTKSMEINSALLSMISLFVKTHYSAIKEAFDKGKMTSPRNAFMHKNKGHLRAALMNLAERSVAGGVIMDEEIETAVATYATANPRAIVIGNKAGRKPVYLTGAWPRYIDLELYGADDTTVRYQMPDGSYVAAGDTAANSPAAGDIAITAVASPSNGGTVTGGGSYASGASVTLRAEAANGFIFTGWSDGITTSSRPITVSGAATYTALFAAASNDDAIGE